MRALLALGAFAALACLVGLALGAVPLSPGEIVAALFSPEAPSANIFARREAQALDFPIPRLWRNG